MTDSISLKQARCIALAAQGFGGRRSDQSSNWPRIRQTIQQMGLLQIDSISVLVRSHYLPVFSRIGHYAQTTLDKQISSPRQRALFEYWGHEASILPVSAHPLLRWRMERAARLEGVYGQITRLVREKPAFIEQIRNEIKSRGPLSSRDLGISKNKTGMWEWHDGKTALEYLFWTGEITTESRRAGFDRVYDLTERVIPAEILNQSTPAEAGAKRELIKIAAKAHGVATAGDLRDYFRLSAIDTKHAIDELVEAGELIPVDVESWQQPGYLYAQARIPRQVNATALLTPFDPLVWERKRTERLFGFHYRIEIYKPAAQRQYGYYVLPFLLNGQLCARVDLKADRTGRTLQVLGVYCEAQKNQQNVAEALSGELLRLARWLELDQIEIFPRGDLAEYLHC